MKAPTKIKKMQREIRKLKKQYVNVWFLLSDILAREGLCGDEATEEVEKLAEPGEIQ